MILTPLEISTRPQSSSTLETNPAGSDPAAKHKTHEFGFVMNNLMNKQAGLEPINSPEALVSITPVTAATSDALTEQALTDMLNLAPSLGSAGDAMVLTAIHLGPHLQVITPQTAAPEGQSLEVFARSQGLDEAALQWLMRTSLTTVPTITTSTGTGTEVLVASGTGGLPAGESADVTQGITGDSSDLPADVTYAIPAGVSSGLPADVTASIPPRVSSGLPPDVTYAIPAGVSSGLPPDVTYAIPAGVSSGLPPDVTYGIPAGVSSGLPPDVTYGIPAGVFSGLPPDLTDGIPAKVSSDLPADVTAGILARGFSGLPAGIPVGKSPSLAGDVAEFNKVLSRQGLAPSSPTLLKGDPESIQGIQLVSAKSSAQEMSSLGTNFPEELAQLTPTNLKPHAHHEPMNSPSGLAAAVANPSDWLLSNTLAVHGVKTNSFIKTDSSSTSLDLAALLPADMQETLELMATDGFASGQESNPQGQGSHNGRADSGTALRTEATNNASPLTEQDSATRRENINTLAEKMGQAVGQRILSELERGQWHLKLSLRPATLGHIEVEMRMRSGEMDAVFTAPNALTRELLNEGMTKLKDTLNQMGMDVASLKVDDGQSRQRGGESTPERQAKLKDNAPTESGPVTASQTITAVQKMGSDGWDVLV